MSKINTITEGMSGEDAATNLNEAIKIIDSDSDFDITTDLYKRLNKVQQTLASSANIAMDLEDGLNGYLSLAHNTTLTISNMVTASEGNIVIDNTGTFTLAISPTPYVINDGAGLITLTDNGRTILSYYYDGTALNITYGSTYPNS